MNIMAQYSGNLSVYPTPQSLQDKVDEYFETCIVQEYLPKLGKYVERYIQPPTQSGLARYLGFSSRAELKNYTNDDERYENVIKQAMLRQEEYLERQLSTTKGNAAGIIFALKNNADWEDETKQKVTNEGGQGPLVLTWSTNAGDVIDMATEQKEMPAPKAALTAGTGNGTEVNE